MNKPKWNFLVDMILFALVVALAFVGIAMAFFMSEGPVDDVSTKYLWQLHRHQWGDIHLVLSLLFVAVFLVHIVLHWAWIKGCARKMLRSTASLGLALVLPAFVVLVAWACAEKDAAEYRDYGTRAGRGRNASHLGTDERPVVKAPEKTDAAKEPPPGGAPPAGIPEGTEVVRVEVNGSMSLFKIEKKTGVPARRVAAELGLPAQADLSRNLGRLRRQYGFAMDDVRKVVTRLSGGKVVAVDSDESGTKPGRGGRNRGKAEPGGSHRQDIQGRMTLLEVGRSTGLPARTIANRLGLPPDTPLDERLGRLKRRYGFTMQDVRDALAALQDH
jgi:hypothetical protein